MYERNCAVGRIEATPGAKQPNTKDQCRAFLIGSAGAAALATPNRRTRAKVDLDEASRRSSSSR